MLKRCWVVRIDSFRAAKELLSKNLFAKCKYMPEEKVRKEVRLYLLHQHHYSVKHGNSQRLSSHSSPEAKSLFCSRMSLVLQEAARYKNSVVAEEALLCAMDTPSILQIFDTKWVKDAFLSCSDSTTWKRLEKRLQDFSASHKVAPSVVELVPSISSASSLSQVSGEGTQRAFKGEESRFEPELCTNSGPNPPRNFQEDQQHGSPAVNGLSSSAIRRLQQSRALIEARPSPFFIHYFLQQKLVADESELMALAKSLRGKTQRITFRVHHQSPLGPAVEAILKHQPGVKPISYLPAFFGAYEMERGTSLPFSQVLSNRRLVQHFTVDRLASYQSISSMLAIRFLDPRPGEYCLDACAAPGGKSSLLLDQLACFMRKELSNDRGHRKGRTNLMQSTVLVAGDASKHRAAELKERLLHSSTPYLAVCHGELLQSCGQYDKVLVDAPCSAESSLGLHHANWRLWHPLKGIEFYHQQVQLLSQAVQRCKPSGGRVLYSTCTFNPLENEAVVATILQRFPHVRLKQLPSVLRPLDNEPGEPLLLSAALEQWLVPGRDGSLHRSMAQAALRGESLPSGLFSFSPDDPAEASDSHPHQRPYSEICKEVHRCAKRLWPHKNEGVEGFFYALLEVGSENYDARLHKFREEINEGSVEATNQVVGKLPEPSVYSLGPPDQRKAAMIHLGRFFLSESVPVGSEVHCDAFKIFSQQHQMVLLFSCNQGWVLASKAVVHQVIENAPRNEDTHSFKLLSLGVPILNAKQELTVEGASFLRNVVPKTPLLLYLSLYGLQLLLCEKELVFLINEKGQLYFDNAQERRVRNLLPFSATPLHSLDVLVSDSLLPNAFINEKKSGLNAIVACHPSNASSYSILEANSDSSWSASHQKLVSAWSFPVFVQEKTAGKIHVRLLSTSVQRNLYISMLGKLRAKQKTLASRSASNPTPPELHPEQFMPSAALYGAASSSPYASSEVTMNDPQTSSPLTEQEAGIYLF